MSLDYLAQKYKSGHKNPPQENPCGGHRLMSIPQIHINAYENRFFYIQVGENVI